MMHPIVQSVVTTVNNAKEDVAHFGEVAIDLASDDETWRNIPLVEHAVKLLHICDIYHTNKIRRNYASFVSALAQSNDVEASSILERLCPDGVVSHDTFETIFDLIVTAQKPFKAELLGRLTVALGQGKLSLDEYDVLALMIQSCSIAALMALPKFLAENDGRAYIRIPGAVAQEALLFSLGVGTRHGNIFRLDSNGIKLAKYGFNLAVDESAL